MPGKQSLSATNLAAHQHLNCDLYIYNIYNGSSANDDAEISELAKAQFQRGLDWETCLYSWLDQSNLLLRVPQIPLDGESLLANISLDDRDHFFITGLCLWPPQAELNERFERFGTQPFKFGLAKPDLVEIKKTEGAIQWRVIDAKASKLVKTSHHIQVYFYAICLSHLLSNPLYQPMTKTGGVWLPPADGFYSDPPSLDDINPINISLLSSALDIAIFRDLPRVLNLPRERVKWHYNPLCHGCKFEPECRRNAQDGGFIGSMPNISIEEARTLKELLNISSSSSFPSAFTSSQSRFTNQLTDIEELHELVKTPNRLDSLARYSALTVKRSKAILALPKKHNPNAPVTTSPVIPRHNHTCPHREDIAVILSIVHDPTSPNPGGEYFAISTFSKKARTLPSLLSGLGEDFVFVLADLLRSLTSAEHAHLTTQFYVWSPAEHSLIQSHIINAALSASASDDDVRICIGALAQGVSLLQTTFQPLLLSGTLLAFVGKEQRKRAEYIACLERIGLSTEGTVDALRRRLESGVKALQSQATNPQGQDRSKELGQLPRIVVVKKEVERQIALPIPGYWDLPECMDVLVSPEVECPDDEKVFILYKQGHLEQLKALLHHRNQCILSILRGLRSYAVTPTKQSFLVNEARVITTNFMDLCQEPNLRKLFFMQQFEVLAKLSALSSARLDGCPDAALLEYVTTVQGTKGIEHVFRLLAGNVDASLKDREGLFDFLLSGDCADPTTKDPYERIPVEALFDDLSVSGMLFPLNRFTRKHWDLQDQRVRNEICVADIRNVCSSSDGSSTEVSIRTWGTWLVQLQPGQTYRLSPRLVDFNTSKILSALFEADLRWSLHNDPDDLYEDDTPHHYVPYLQLILDPSSFGAAMNADEFVQKESRIQNAFARLLQITASAGPLTLKASQHRAAQRIMGNRLSVIWGPPGTGKTFTIASSLLRLIEVQHGKADPEVKVVFVTAMTHAAIEACHDKLKASISAYKALEGWDTTFLDNVAVEIVQKGKEHPPPPPSRPSGPQAIKIYAGTIFQLYTFTKQNKFSVDCLVIDEAGQISLGAVALVMRSLSPSGRVIIAGDSEQLAPILSAQYPRLKTNMLFGSVLDSLMFARFEERPPDPHGGNQESQETGDLEPTQNTVVQLTENFRLNPDLAAFVSLIYARKFKPQKSQTRQIVDALQSLERSPIQINGVQDPIVAGVHAFFSGLLQRMNDTSGSRGQLGNRQRPRASLSTGTFPPPTPKKGNASIPEHTAVSLALLRLQTRSSRTDDLAYEAHVRGEAALAVCLAICLRRVMEDDDVFIATPHRIQREAVRTCIKKLKEANPHFERVFGGERGRDRVRVDTIERLQGAEAAFVICLFSLPRSYISDLPFLLERRRLNVAISRAKNLCVLITSDEVLCPSVKVLANQDAAKGYSFLKEFEERAWKSTAIFDLNVDNIYTRA